MKRVLELFLALEQLEADGRPDISRTKTSKQSDKLIDDFQQRLAAFVYYEQGRVLSVDDERRLLVLFYKFIEAQYFLGQEYSDKATGVPKSVTKSDLQKIEKQAKDAMQAFLKSLSDRRAIINPMLHFVQHFDMEQLLQSYDDFDDTILQGALEKSRAKKEGIFNIDWLNKLLLLMPDPQMVTGITITSSDTGIRALNSGTLSNAKRVVFTTRNDLRVCPICEPYDGTTYPVDPKTGIVIGGPLIPDNTHPRCRCRYLTVGDEEG